MPLDSRAWTLTSGGKPIPGPASLTICGPAVPVEVSIPSALAKRAAAAGVAVPSPVAGYALIDTGASHTCVDKEVAPKLGLFELDRTEVLSPTGKKTQSIYAVRLDFPGCSITPVDPWLAVGSELASAGQTIAGKPLIILLGRDFLSGKLLVYDGVFGTWNLSSN